MKKNVIVGMIIGIILIAGIVGVILGMMFIDTASLERPEFERDRLDPETRDLYLTATAAITVINITISFILIYIYFKIYRNTKSEFTIGLIIITTALLLYAITSNPLLSATLGYKMFGGGPFFMIPHMFTTIALAVLLYISLK